ncbi:MAG TPA: hypothetical protein VEH02_10635, partial [Pseudolabrys sp.]|nr:hypothetical protein [Pseudolabrys sp.]
MHRKMRFTGREEKLTGTNRNFPGADPEKINDMNPPAHRLAEVYRTGSKTKSYVKVRDANRIL